MQCTAKSRRTGERCKAQAITGKRVCRYHGGRSRSGPASATWKDGRYSKAFPTGLLQAFRDRAQDPNILVLRSEIAVLQTRLEALLVRVFSDGDAGALWGSLGARWTALKQAQLAGDAARAAELFGRVDETITAGAAESATWREIGETVERIRRAVDTETRRTQLAQEYVSRELAGAAMLELGVLVRENVSDPRARAAIADGIGRFLRGSVSSGNR